MSVNEARPDLKRDGFSRIAISFFARRLSLIFFDLPLPAEAG
jgi:hypothetical protein